MLSATAGRTDTDKAAVNTPGKCRSDMATPEKRPYISVAALISQPAARRHIGIKKACNIKSGSGVPNKTKVAKITKAQVEEIAKLKMPDLNAASVEAAMSMIEGTCRSMGVTVVE